MREIYINFHMLIASHIYERVRTACEERYDVCEPIEGECLTCPSNQAQVNTPHKYLNSTQLHLDALLSHRRCNSHLDRDVLESEKI